MAALHARRGAQLLRFCGVKVSSHRIIGAERIPTDETVSFNVDEGETLTDEQMQEQRPLDFLLEREYEEFNNSSGEGMMAVLYCGMVERTREKTEVIYKSSHIKRFYNKPPSPEYSESVATFFSFLGPQITLLSATPYSDMVKFSPPEFSKHAVANYTPLMAALYGLATSKGERELTKITGPDYPDFQSVYLAVAAARDLILRCSHKYPHHL